MLSTSLWGKNCPTSYRMAWGFLIAQMSWYRKWNLNIQASSLSNLNLTNLLMLFTILWHIVRDSLSSNQLRNAPTDHLPQIFIQWSEMDSRQPPGGWWSVCALIFNQSSCNYTWISMPLKVNKLTIPKHSYSFFGQCVASWVATNCR